MAGGHRFSLATRLNVRAMSLDLSGQLQVNSYPCSSSLLGATRACAPMRQRAAAVVIGVSDFNALHTGKHNEKVQLCAYLDALPRLTGPIAWAGLGQPRTGRGALLPKLLILPVTDRADAEKRSRAWFGADPRVHRIATGVPGLHGAERRHQMPHKKLQQCIQIVGF
jgi:hypothetical protein